MWTLPNIITLARILITPVIALLPFIEGYWPKFICFVVFLVAVGLLLAPLLHRVLHRFHLDEDDGAGADRRR